MRRDADKKRTLLASWWADLLPRHSFRLFRSLEPLDMGAAVARLSSLPAVPSVYVLLAEDGVEVTPVYVGKAYDPAGRWQQHLDSWARGAGSYGRWRQALLDEDGRARYDLTLLVVPVGAIVTAPIPGFPCTVGSVEYQLIGLAADAFPGRLLNHEGQGRC